MINTELQWVDVEKEYDGLSLVAQIWRPITLAS